MMQKSTVEGVLEVYKRAWETQDADLILTAFTPDAVYRERAFEPPHVGHAGIRKYWISKVQQSQANIRFQLLSLYVDGNTAIAEWEAIFDDKEIGRRLQMKEVAILEFVGDLIGTLREYWQSQVITE